MKKTLKMWYDGLSSAYVYNFHTLLFWLFDYYLLHTSSILLVWFSSNSQQKWMWLRFERGSGKSTLPCTKLKCV